MIGSAHHELAKELTSSFQSALEFYTPVTAIKILSLLLKLQQFYLDAETTFLCSIDISLVYL